MHIWPRVTDRHAPEDPGQQAPSGLRIPLVITDCDCDNPHNYLDSTPAEARDRAEFLLSLLNIPQRLWALPPATFSGGEQQRVNIARSLIVDYPVLLLDEPTASLDAGNRDRVVELISQRRDAGGAVVGIFHDLGVRELLANRIYEVAPVTTSIAA